MNSFVRDILTRIYLDLDQLDNLGKEVSALGKEALLCYGGGSIKKGGLYDRVMAQLKAAGMEVFEFLSIDPNPGVFSVSAGAGIYKKEKIDVLLAAGGGLVLDCTRYIGATAYRDGDEWDIPLDKVPVEQCLPTVTVFTLAVTSSEMGPDGVISSPGTKDKIGHMLPFMQPKVSFLDPTETCPVSKHQIACSSSDISPHLLEIYSVPESGNMYVLGCFVEDMIKTVMRYTPVAVERPDHYEVRANLIQTSSRAINEFAGALQNCERTRYPIEHELSTIHDIIHGLGLTIVTPRWVRYVLGATTAYRFYQYGVNMFSIDPFLPEMEAAEKSIKMTADFLFGKPDLVSTLTEVGIDDSNFDIMAERAYGGGTLQGYKPLNHEGIRKVLTMCL